MLLVYIEAQALCSVKRNTHELGDLGVRGRRIGEGGAFGPVNDDNSSVTDTDYPWPRHGIVTRMRANATRNALYCSRGEVRAELNFSNEYFPKRTRLDDLKPSLIRAVEERINARPRKVLAYYAPQKASTAA